MPEEFLQTPAWHVYANELANSGFQNTDVVVTAMWKSIGESAGRRALRVGLVEVVDEPREVRGQLRLLGGHRPESSTTNRMSADERSESVTRSLPGCTRQ